MQAAIEVRDLHKSYGNFEAVGGIDFQVVQGEVFWVPKSSRNRHNRATIQECCTSHPGDLWERRVRCLWEGLSIDPLSRAIPCVSTSGEERSALPGMTSTLATRLNDKGDAISAIHRPSNAVRRFVTHASGRVPTMDRYASCH